MMLGTATPTTNRLINHFCQSNPEAPYWHFTECEECYQALDAAIDEREELLGRAMDALASGTASRFEVTALVDDIRDLLDGRAWASSLGGGAK